MSSAEIKGLHQRLVQTIGTLRSQMAELEHLRAEASSTAGWDLYNLESEVAQSLTQLSTHLPPALYLERLMQQHVVVAAIAATCKLRVPEALQAKPLTAAQLADRTYPKSDAVMLQRLLRLLVDHGVISEDNGLYSINQVSQLLLRENPRSLAGGFATHARVSDMYFDMDKCLSESKTPSAARRGSKQNLFELTAGSIDTAQNYNQYMHTLSTAQAEAIISDCPFSHVQKLVEVAGGTGSLLTTVLDKYPAMQGVLVDQPHVLCCAIKHSRMQTVPLDIFLDPLPEADAFFMKTVLREWDDIRAGGLLRNVRKSIAPTGSLYVCEVILGADWKQDPHARSKVVTDVALMALCRGRERSKDEIVGLLQDAGFTLERVVPLRCNLSLLIAKPLPNAA
eukprot:TRINITY_DN1537_c0_g1_i1.p1 TRINITY_DN1537_c0_g1~~TRINITY_DN1537_c0_g1_i1.p1  ORF type:complete len:404 (-),score=67.29 TRINITY_DN1537_c0_g1_i1:245-1429(-)